MKQQKKNIHPSVWLCEALHVGSLKHRDPAHRSSQYYLGFSLGGQYQTPPKVMLQFFPEWPHHMMPSVQVPKDV